MLETILEGFQQRDRRALSQLLTLAGSAKNDGQVAQVLETLPAKPTRVVAITGSAGVGKSTLIGKLIETIRKQGKTVAVLACDPESPRTGGALLGDRFRMPAKPDEGVFIRSLAAPGGPGFQALLNTRIRILETFGFDLILIETVGAGQGDTTVSDRVDLLVVLLQAESGDDLQWEKAGLVEVADVLVIHKADLPGSDTVEAQVVSMLRLGAQAVPPVVRVSSRTGQGLEELLQLLEMHPSRIGSSASVQQLLGGTQQLLATRFQVARSAQDPEIESLLRRYLNQEMDLKQASNDLLDCLAKKPGFLEKPGF